MTHPREDALLASIEGRRDDIVALTQALVRGRRDATMVALLVWKVLRTH